MGLRENRYVGVGEFTLTDNGLERRLGPISYCRPSARNVPRSETRLELQRLIRLLSQGQRDTLIQFQCASLPVSSGEIVFGKHRV